MTRHTERSREPSRERTRATASARDHAMGALGNPPIESDQPAQHTRARAVAHERGTPIHLYVCIHMRIQIHLDIIQLYV